MPPLIPPSVSVTSGRPPVEYDETIRLRRRSGLMSNYFDHLLLLDRIAVLRM